MTLALILWSTMFLAGCAVDAPAPARIHRAAEGSKRTDQQACYICRLHDETPSDALQLLFEELKGSHLFTKLFKGFSACGVDVGRLEALAKHPSMTDIYEDQQITVLTTQDCPERWHLDRIDQRLLPRDLKFIYESTGAGVTIFIVDTGVQGDHQDFFGESGTRVEQGYDFIDKTSPSADTDCHGHGTHVAGIAAGKFSGVAKGANIFPMRVMDCNGMGSVSVIIASLEWIVSDLAKTPRPAVINMSIGGSFYRLLNDAVERLVSEVGGHVVVAAGNSAHDACLDSPASAPSAITVGSTTSSDALSSFSNTGSCVDLLAPGSSIYSADARNLNGFKYLSGTSMASPAVAGVAATVLEKYHPISPVNMVKTLKEKATMLNSTAAVTTNHLLYSAITGFPNSPPGNELPLPPPQSPLSSPEPFPEPSPEPSPAPEPAPPPAPCPGKSQSNKKNTCLPSSQGIEETVPNRRAASLEVTSSAASAPRERPEGLLWLGVPILGALVIVAFISLRRSSDAQASGSLHTLA